LGLKDATPLNILFNGSQPVFIDSLSIEPRDPTQPIWAAYGQFVRTFLLPLAASKHLGWSMRRVFTGARDGLRPAELYDALNWSQRLRKSLFGTVTGPVMAEGMARRAQPQTALKRAMRKDVAEYVLRSHYRRLGKTLNSFAPSQRKSGWTSYRDGALHHPEYDSKRLELMESVVASHRPKTVLDIGTNDGIFAFLAANHGAQVVAIDRDEAVVDQLFRKRERGRDRVLPLVVDLLDPTPGSGWRNEERPSFLDRARGGFEMVFALAVLHHLVIGDGLALETVLELLADLTTHTLIAEFVPATDPLCRKLAAGRPIDPDRWSLETFERLLASRFSVVTRTPVGFNGRIVFELRVNR
jgi:hypothetical protein